MEKRIVYTRLSDGGVSICCPASEAIAWMGCGGFWDHHPRGFMDVQIERQIARGIAILFGEVQRALPAAVRDDDGLERENEPGECESRGLKTPGSILWRPGL